MKRIVNRRFIYYLKKKRLYWPWSWARFSAKTRNRHTIYHSQSIYLKCRWMEPGHQFVLTQPEYSLCWKEKERKPSGPQLLPDHQRNMLPPVKDALEECDCTQCDLQDSERKLLSKSAPHRYDVKKSQNKVCHSLLRFQWLTKHVELRQYSRWLQDDRKFRQKFLRAASFRISALPYTWSK